VHLSLLEVNAHKTKYSFMSRNQKVELYHNIKNNSSFFQSVEVFRYLRTVLTNPNPIQEEIKNKLKSRNAC
jgi:hypothetical protein